MHDHGIQCVHDLLFVVLSYLVAVLGSYTALQLAIGIPIARNGNERTTAVVAAGAAMGGGAIWAMHFIAMLACKMDIPVTYGFGLSTLSALIAMGSCMAGLAIVGSGLFAWTRLAAGGTLMGLGVASMHYTGMAAMNMPATIVYDVNLVAISVVIAIVASSAALWLAFHMRGAVQMIGSALVMGIAVCGMHYTGMLAAHFEPNAADANISTATGIGGAYLGAAVFAITSLLLVVLLITSILRQQKRAQVAI